MKLSPQKRYLYGILKDNGWVCSCAFDNIFIRDYRKRISEMNQEGFIIDSKVCDRSCGVAHRSGVHSYRLVEAPKTPVYEYELVDGVRVPKLTYRTL